MVVSVRGEIARHFSSSSLSKVTHPFIHRWVMIDGWGKFPKKLLLWYSMINFSIIFPKLILYPFKIA